MKCFDVMASNAVQSVHVNLIANTEYVGAEIGRLVGSMSMIHEGGLDLISKIVSQDTLSSGKYNITPVAATLTRTSGTSSS
jgi:hypothetical protein